MTKTRIKRIELPSLPATAAETGLGCFPLRSPQSRAAARSLIAAREASEDGEFRYELRSILDDKPVNLDGLTERIKRSEGETVKPGDYPLRSRQSRAAARSLLEWRLADRKRLDVVLTSSIPRPGGALALNVGKWHEGADGTLTRFSMIPSGMTIEEAERIAGGSRAGRRL